MEKQRFKIGTLDQLMELNETLAKVDQTLDSTVKKIEKQAREMVGRDLKIEVTKQQQGKAKLLYQIQITKEVPNGFRV